MTSQRPLTQRPYDTHSTPHKAPLLTGDHSPVAQVLTKPVGEKEAAAKDGKRDVIPIPDIRMTPSYEQDYRPNFVIPPSYFRSATFGAPEAGPPRCCVVSQGTRLRRGGRCCSPLHRMHG